MSIIQDLENTRKEPNKTQSWGKAFEAGSSGPSRNEGRGSGKNDDDDDEYRGKSGDAPGKNKPESKQGRNKGNFGKGNSDED